MYDFFAELPSPQRLNFKGPVGVQCTVWVWAMAAGIAKDNIPAQNTAINDLLP